MEEPTKKRLDLEKDGRLLCSATEDQLLDTREKEEWEGRRDQV
jgi:hypothetical protein